MGVASAQPVLAGSRTGDEVRGKPRLDLLGNDAGGAVLRVAQRAYPRAALLGAGNVVGIAGERLSGDDGFVGRDVGQGVIGVDAVILDVGPAAVDVDDDL